MRDPIINDNSGPQASCSTDEVSDKGLDFVSATFLLL